MSMQACKNCRYSFETEGVYVDTLACRRRSPVRSSARATYENNYGLGAFPRVNRAEWCGEWEAVGAPVHRAEPETSQERMFKWFWR